MNLNKLGYNNIKATANSLKHLSDFELGRIISEHKEKYLVATQKGEIEAEITGNMRYSAIGREDFPAVGDWVALIMYGDDFAIINEILPRYSIIKRKAVGNFGEVQLIGSNIDYAIIMQSANRDFNINRIERYLSICYSSKIEPIIVLTKIDLVNEGTLSDLRNKIKQRINDVVLFEISNESKSGLHEFNQSMISEKTYCMLGSSGVGKSSLLNNLAGKDIMKTKTISTSTDKGRHASTHRELRVLENGSILMDNPGMREVGITDSSEGINNTYDKIQDFALNCKFKNCSHTNETGCAVIKAADNGVIDKSYYQNYLKLQKESAHFESSVQEKRRKDKDFGKMVKNIKKQSKKNRFY